MHIAETRHVLFDELYAAKDKTMWFFNPRLTFVCDMYVYVCLHAVDLTHAPFVYAHDLPQTLKSSPHPFK